jgi:glycosyltransferase involved in cell wall biosynthesis
VPGHWQVKERYSDRARGLLGVANYVPGKGTARLIRVLSEIRDLPWQLTVRGNTDFDPGHYRSMLGLVDQLGLSDRIALLGPVPHDTVNEEMIQADLLVHFSERESYSMVTAEAIASGLPVLSYPTGNAEAFGWTGLVRHLSYPAEGHALRQLIEHADDYASLRRMGPRYVRTWRDVGDEFLQWLDA